MSHAAKLPSRTRKPQIGWTPASATDGLFASAFHNSPALQSVVRASDGVIVEANDTFLRKMGRTREQVIGKTPYELGTWVDPRKLDDYRRALESKGKVQGFETRLRANDGRIVTVLLSSHTLEIQGALHYVSAGVDITERKEAEAKLLESERRLRENEARARSLYEGISAAVVVHDETGRLLQINSASLSLFGSTRSEDILGKHPAHFSAARQPDGEDSAVAARRHIEKALATGADRFEWLARRLDGTEFPVEVTLTAVQIEGHRALQAVIIDLTERKRAEAELQNALAKERELSQLKSDFVSLVSHEFRTPLEIIMSSADNLQRYYERLTPEKREQLLLTINKSVRRMSGMMEEVLVLGRLEADAISFNPVQFDLPSVCQRICDEIESATDKRCLIRLEIEPKGEQAVGDEILLRHILTNLLSNAVKYSSPGQQVTLVVRRDRIDGIFCVSDSGCGIPAADQKRLFQAFHRGANVRQIPGTGLGLLIVQRCVELHGGNIYFESVEGKGTTFTLRLPLFQTSSPRERLQSTANQ